MRIAIVVAGSRTAASAPLIHPSAESAEAAEYKTRMTNDEARMTKEARMKNAEPTRPGSTERLGFVIRISSFFRHSCFVIRHLTASCARLDLRFARCRP